MAASVVDLPEPVAPVTRISPRGFSASCASTDGAPRSVSDTILLGIVLKTAAGPRH